jgi:hypothetical protein
MATKTAPIALIACLGFATAAYAQPSIVPDSRPTSSVSIELPVSVSTETEVVDTEKSREAATPAAIPLEAPIDPSTYVCGPGDLFALHFWGPQNFQLHLGVDVEGRTFIAKLGHVKVAGHTLDKVRADITRAAKRHYPGVQIDLVLSQPRQFMVHIVGEVKKPGVYRARARARLDRPRARSRHGVRLAPPDHDPQARRLAPHQRSAALRAVGRSSAQSVCARR